MPEIANQVWLNYINGQWHAEEQAKEFQTRDPGKPEIVVAQYKLATTRDAERAVRAARDAFPAWSQTPAAERMKYVHDFIDVWRSRIHEPAELTTKEMGKPLRESRSEAARAVDEMRFWAGEALRLGDRTFPSTRPLTDAYTIRQPIGPVAAITPWNFPILSPLRKVIPALICGCTVVLKPALQAPGPSVLIAQMLDEVGVPPGVFNLLIGTGREVGEVLIQHRDIAGISFTGSTDVGIHIGVVAAARNARVQLEMGGKNAAVVASCHDTERVAREITAAAFTASGQRCTAVSRVIVLEDEREALEQALVREVEKLVMGYGMQEETTMGPIVSEDQLNTISQYVEDAKQEGKVRILTGGHRLDGHEFAGGYYYAPTLITDVEPGTRLATEEIFGPVLVIIPVASFEDAVRANNETRYGLTAAIFTDDMDAAHAFVAQSRTGMVHVNHGTSSEGHVPFGGVKESGQGAFGIGDTSKLFFTDLKAVYNVHQASIESVKKLMPKRQEY
jgi:aldehyde dehydrogenase (NAD+)